VNVPPAAGIRLARQIHVWRASTDVEPGRLRVLWSTLSTDERERAERFRFSRDRQRFIARRGLLRAILGRYVGAEARELRFSYGRFGKPAVASGPGRPALEFNLSHSAGLALLALTAREGVGIDVERIDVHIDYREVAVSVFPAQESEALQRTPPARARRMFFRLWSLREAVGKARGDGLAVLDQRQADTAAEESGPMWGCSATELDIAEGYAAALAVCGAWQLRPGPWRGRLDEWEACCCVGLETC
jgi:4'-phosphopantetheinyl transferase